MCGRYSARLRTFPQLSLKVKKVFRKVGGLTVGLALVFSFSTCGTRGGKRLDSPRQEKREVTGAQRQRAVSLTVKGNRIDAEVAATPEQRTLGLSFRTALHPDSGMVFVFDEEQILRFWMKNTYIPLAIAFIDKNGVITDIIEMTPLDTQTRYESSRPVRYALEVNSGWFLVHGIEPGDTVCGLPVPGLGGE